MALPLGPAGNRTRVEEHSGRSVDDAYDGLYRMTQEEIVDPVVGNEIISYTYDPFGNRLTKADSQGTTAYAYDANDRVLTEAAPGYTNIYAYDDNGNTTQRSDGAESTDYIYDYENRLLVAQTGPTQIACDYDADGIRVASAVDGVVTYYVVDKNRNYAQVLEETDAIGSPLISYIYGDDLISQDRGTAKSYYHFGALIDQTGSTPNNYLFSGEQYDPNVGFYYLRARYYETSIGRFVTSYPFEGRAFEPATLHRYLYAGNNPVMFVDPSGEMLGLVGMMQGLRIRSILTSIPIINTAVVLTTARLVPFTIAGIRFIVSRGPTKIKRCHILHCE